MNTLLFLGSIGTSEILLSILHALEVELREGLLHQRLNLVVAEIAAIAVNLHLADIGEACLAHYLFGKLMKTGFAETALRLPRKPICRGRASRARGCHQG